MKKIIFISVLSLFSCKRNNPVRPPVGGFLSKTDLDTSKNRSKNLNEVERTLIENWITTQPTKFYPTKLNYWTDVQGFDQRDKRPDESLVSYSYDLYDFDKTKIYDQSISRKNARFGHFEELKAVENALRYIENGEEVTLLVPSVLAYGTYGDQNKIDNDIPLIIKLKAL